MKARWGGTEKNANERDKRQSRKSPSVSSQPCDFTADRRKGKKKKEKNEQTKKRRRAKTGGWYNKDGVTVSGKKECDLKRGKKQTGGTGDRWKSTFKWARKQPEVLVNQQELSNGKEKSGGKQWGSQPKGWRPLRNKIKRKRRTGSLKKSGQNRRAKKKITRRVGGGIQEKMA